MNKLETNPNVVWARMNALHDIYLRLHGEFWNHRWTPQGQPVENSTQVEFAKSLLQGAVSGLFIIVLAAFWVGSCFAGTPNTVDSTATLTTTLLAMTATLALFWGLKDGYDVYRTRKSEKWLVFIGFALVIGPMFFWPAIVSAMNGGGPVRYYDMTGAALTMLTGGILYTGSLAAGAYHEAWSWRLVREYRRLDDHYSNSEYC